MTIGNRLLLKRTVEVAVLTSVFLLPFELYFRQQVHDLGKKKQIIESRLDSTVIAVMGSSHTSFGIDPNYLDWYATNLAFPAQSLYYDCNLAAIYYPRMPRLKLVVFDLSVHSFGYDEYKSSPRECFIYDREFGIPIERPKAFEIRKLSGLVLSLTTVFPDNVFNYFDKRVFAETNANPNAAAVVSDDFQPDGFYRNSIVVKREFDDQEGIDRVKAHFGGLDSLYVKPITELFEKTILNLRNKGINIVFVTTPHNRVYYNHLSASALKDFHARIDYLANTQGVTYFDYLKDSRFSLEDFADVDHLNYKGAKKLSVIFNADLKKKFGNSLTNQ